MRYDAILIGGSYAGMAAGLQLARARRTVLVIDAGERRNRFASHSHGFIGQDGVEPAAIAMAARQQLLAYPTLTWLQGRVLSISGQADGFTVRTADGGSHQGRRILLAHGVSDQIPDIAGLAERWGQSVLHCPYCHGYELNQGRIGVVAVGPQAVHQAELLTDWGQVTLLANNALALDTPLRTQLQRRGVQIEEAPITRIEGVADVRLADGRLLPFAGLFTATRCAPMGDIATQAGCALEPTPMGTQVRTDGEGKTSVPGIFACGDAARAPHSVSLAVGSGAMVGMQLHRSLLWPESLPPAAPPEPVAQQAATAPSIPSAQPA